MKPLKNTVPLFMLPTRAISACSSSGTQNRPKELYSCKESCTWCWALEQLQCVTCTHEQLPLKPRSKLFVEPDIRSFSRTLQGNTTRGNALIRPGRLPAPPISNSCSIFHSFPSTLCMWARGEGIRDGDLEVISRGPTPGSWHTLSLV